MSVPLSREAASLVARLRLFTPARWEAACPPWGSRADAVHHLAQSLVAMSGEARVALPRLASPLVLPDQLAVAADDLVRTSPAVSMAADAVAHLLVHRVDLLGEPPPTGLVAALGEADEAALLTRGLRACRG